MEEGQRHLYKDGAKTVTGVLILVVMEEGQRPLQPRPLQTCTRVLILVVMEEGQRLIANNIKNHRNES